MTPGSGEHFLYFAYGSNLDAARLHRSCPGARPCGRARLPAYRLRFPLYSRRWGGGVADVVPDPSAEVWGALWRIAAGEAAALDRQEGVDRDPPRYRRVELSVETSVGGRLSCLAYRVAAPDPDAALAPSPDYLAAMLRGARAFSLPEAYVARLAALRPAPE
ncbi:MAG: gamma-glutamylcyclotransferase [Chloroflexi bacterium]|nr:gamma-glutamylcyclotransferase [Chloroflexota bacterium]